MRLGFAGASAAGVLAAAAMIPFAAELGMVLATGLALDLLMLGLGLWAVVNGWIGSADG